MALLEYAKALWEIAAIIAVQSLPAHKSTNFVARLRNRWIMAPTPSTRRLLDGVEVPVPPLDGASPSAFSTPHAIKCDSHTGDNLQMRQARDVRGRALRLPIGVR